MADPAPAPPPYRSRLQLEGGILAGLGLAASVALLGFDDHAADAPLSTIGQLAAVAVLLGIFGPRGVRSAVAGATPVADPGTAQTAGLTPVEGPGTAGTGEPTPLWHLPLIVAVLTAPFLLAGVPDAALRVTGGSTLVGLAQSVLLTRVVGRDEQATGRTYVRLPGSRILRGTKLGYWAGRGSAGAGRVLRTR